MESFFQFTDAQVHPLDIFLIVFYMLGILAFGIYMGRGVKNSSDFFIAGKTLSWWVVGLSIVGSNIGSNDYVGAAGSAYKIGIAQANFEWIGAIPAMILAAFLFIPYYWKAGVYSIPEYLGLRYNQGVRFISASVLSVFTVLMVGAFLWSTALMLKTYLGWPVYFSILVSAFVVGVYTATGGLKAVTITDTVQVFIMFAGAVGLMYLGIEKAGGLNAFFTKINTDHPDHLKAFLPATHLEFPWPGVVLGLGLVLSPAYWCTSQVILQRTLGAKSQWDGQASMIFAAFAKTLVPFLIIFPGFLALVLVTNPLEFPDQALPWVVKHVLPPGLSGILFVSFIAALQSSVDSTLNSTATMFTRDIVGVLRKERDDAFDLKLGKIVTTVALLLGMLVAPLTSMFAGIYAFIQEMLSLFQGPMFALVLWGILSKKPSSKGGLATIILGLLFAILLNRTGVNMLYVAFYSFVGSSLILFIVSHFSLKKTDEELHNLTIHEGEKK